LLVAVVAVVLDTAEAVVLEGLSKLIHLRFHQHQQLPSPSVQVALLLLAALGPPV
jgi:hypothetical protein